ncbi:hypothetical protein YW3DRAFT_06484 [Streptomyces sp. MnatMP-M77]|uniref:hypothetical protein n=1 Tax=unclassified Streptomyces TaxID=2593676 RepID=UPI00080549CB|nr:hypothetical protein [Streptomyces sp. MnatMP-M77]MYT77496.1 hypothetical protein [Streptomyces sp. SID8364]SBU99208.1 hypothetical protein YW3DRAFT_06484 [Streptomyces sp. MnatMP-M77]
MGKQSTAVRSVESIFAAWLLLSLVSQHPHQVFDRFRRYDKVGLLIPNWRFFAPQPARHDYHLLFRTIAADGTESDWQAATQIHRRDWAQVVWFPGRRQEKAIFDICSELVQLVGSKSAKVVEAPGYRLLRNFVNRLLDADPAANGGISGFQFLVVRYSGHDHSEEPQYSFVSPFIPYTPLNSSELVSA